MKGVEKVMLKGVSTVILLVITMGLLGGFGIAQESVQEFALIHSLAVGEGAPKTFPETITVKVNKPVRLFNISADKPGVVHNPVVISSDELGNKPVFGVKSFNVEPGKITVVEFTPNQTGTFFITHLQHAHPIVGKLIVEK